MGIVFFDDVMIKKLITSRGERRETLLSMSKKPSSELSTKTEHKQTNKQTNKQTGKQITGTVQGITLCSQSHTFSYPFKQVLTLHGPLASSSIHSSGIAHELRYSYTSI